MQKDKDIEQIRKEFIIIKIISWILLCLIAIAVSFIIIKASHADLNSDAQAASNPYGSYGNLNGLMSYGRQNITTSCNQNPDFISTSYTVGSSGDISAVIQMNTNNGSGYNYTYNIPAIISGICSNGFISCPAGQWYGGGVTCNNYAIVYSPSSGFSLQSLGSNIMGVPATTTTSIALNGTTAQASTVTNPNATMGGLANCFCLNDSCLQGGTPISEIQVKQILTDLGGQAVSAVQSGSPDTIGASTLFMINSPYHITYSGGDFSSCNGNSNYTSPNNLEGLYNEGGSALNSEVTTSQESTANLNTQSALGLTSTPTGSLTTVQNNSFGGMSGGTCQIENMVNFGQITTYTSNETFNSASTFSSTTAGVGAGGGSNCANGSCFPSSPTTITLSTNNPQSTCAPEELPGGIALNGPTMTGSGACSGTITLSSTTGINSGGQITCNLSDDGCNAGGTLSFTGGANTLNISGSGNGTVTVQPFYQYYPKYSQPVNNCSTYQGKTNCTLTGEQVCDQNDSNCVTTISNSNPVGTTPDFVWTYGQTDDNLPISTITWTINMNGATATVTPSETTDTINYGTLDTSSSSAGGGNDFPYINETWECTGNQSYNFDTMNTQETAVTSPTSASMNSTNTAFSYTGVNGNQHSNIAIDNPTNYGSQQYECVVEQTTTATSVSSSLTAQTANQVTPLMSSAANTETLNCTNSGTVDAPVWNCPVPTEYTIQEGCTDAGTINNSNFAPAAVDLQVLDKAGASLICSAN